MKLYEVITQDLSLLLEAVKYQQMFGEAFLKAYNYLHGPKQAEKMIKNEISWAKQKLKKEDRIVWYMRAIKIITLEDMAKVAESRFKKGDKKVERGHQFDLFDKKVTRKDVDMIHNAIDGQIKGYNRKSKGTKIGKETIHTHFENIDKLKHDLPIFVASKAPDIQTHVWGWETPKELTEKFSKMSRKWNRIGSRAGKAYGKVFLDLPGDFAWYDLGRAYCQKEGDRMGHCGNSPSKMDQNQTILSLREKVSNQGHDVSHATFIFHKREGELGEMKGFDNRKVEEQYHKHVVALLEDDRIKGVKGGGYSADSNFSIYDLDEETREKLKLAKPTLETRRDKIKHGKVTDKLLIELQKHAIRTDPHEEYPVVIREWDNARAVINDIGDHHAEDMLNSAQHADERDSYHEPEDFDHAYDMMSEKQKNLIERWIELKTGDETPSITDIYDTIHEHHPDFIYDIMDEVGNLAARANQEQAVKDIDELVKDEYQYTTEPSIDTDFEVGGLDKHDDVMYEKVYFRTSAEVLIGELSKDDQENWLEYHVEKQALVLSELIDDFEITLEGHEGYYPEASHFDDKAFQDEVEGMMNDFVEEIEDMEEEQK